MPRFARQNSEKVFISIYYITSLFLFTVICLQYMLCLGWEEDLPIDHILGSLNLVVLVFVEGEP